MKWPKNSSGTATTAIAEAPRSYVGRFAPSPTGPLHFGSLIAAVASYLQAKARGGSWLLRIEDIDPPRQQAGAEDAILAALERYGFEWDGAVTRQRRNTARHEELVDRLLAAGKAYPCGCSRRDLETARMGPLGRIYPGTCRDGCDATEVAIRVLTDNTPISFDDALQGRQSQRLASESGDFIIRRRDGLIAYHLAVVVDDHDQGVTEVVRGIDLLDSTPRQIHLQRLLGFPQPVYLHIPVIVNDEGQKLSKLTGAPGLPSSGTRRILVAAFDALGQRAPADLAAAQLGAIWEWGIAHWQPGVMHARKTIPSGQNPIALQQNPLS